VAEHRDKDAVGVAVVVAGGFLQNCLLQTNTIGRCCDFINIFAEKTGDETFNFD
jgi:hypothetical protein